MSYIHLSIIIPTYNEAGNIGLLIKEIKSQLKNKISYEIIVVDDNSPDNTAQEAKKLIDKDGQVRLFVRKKDRGLATAIGFGISQAKGKVIVGMDADFNHPPQLILKLVSELKRVDLVVASRFIPGGGMQDKWRFYATYAFNIFLNKILNFPIMDNMSGFYAIGANQLKQLPLQTIFQGYGEYHLRLVWYARQYGLRIKQLPVFYPQRQHGQSKSNLIKMFWQYLVTAFKLRYNLK